MKIFWKSCKYFLTVKKMVGIINIKIVQKYCKLRKNIEIFVRNGAKIWQNITKTSEIHRQFVLTIFLKKLYNIDYFYKLWRVFSDTDMSYEGGGHFENLWVTNLCYSADDFFDLEKNSKFLNFGSFNITFLE